MVPMDKLNGMLYKWRKETNSPVLTKLYPKYIANFVPLRTPEDMDQRWSSGLSGRIESCGANTGFVAYSGVDMESMPFNGSSAVLDIHGYCSPSPV